MYNFAVISALVLVDPALQDGRRSSVWELGLMHSQPHIAGVVVDCTETFGGAGQVLHSEVMCALSVLRHQVRHLTMTRHHTVPAPVVCVQHDSRARVTQAFLDVPTGRLVLRQSRVLELRGANGPTEDAFLLLRWMANTPVGDTAYPDAAETCREEVEEVEEVEVCQSVRGPLCYPAYSWLIEAESETRSEIC